MTNQSSTADSHHVLPPHSSIVNRQSSIPWSLLLLTCTLFLSCTPNREIEIEEIAHYNTSGWAHDVTLDHGFLYVSDRQGGYLVFRRDGDYTGPRIHAPVQDVISLAPHNGRPLLASRFEGLVLVSPSGRVEDRLSNGDIANAVVTRNDLAFAAYGSHGLVICSIGAQSLSLVSELPTPGWSHDVKLWRNRVLMADWNYGLRVVDISVPENPREIGILPSPATAICISVGELMGKPAAAVAEGHAGVSLVALDINGRPAFLSRHILGLNPADAPHPEAGGWLTASRCAEVICSWPTGSGDSRCSMCAIRASRAQSWKCPLAAPRLELKRKPRPTARFSCFWPMVRKVCECSGLREEFRLQKSEYRSELRA